MANSLFHTRQPSDMGLPGCNMWKHSSIHRDEYRVAYLFQGVQGLLGHAEFGPERLSGKQLLRCLIGERAGTALLSGGRLAHSECMTGSVDAVLSWRSMFACLCLGAAKRKGETCHEADDEGGRRLVWGHCDLGEGERERERVCVRVFCTMYAKQCSIKRVCVCISSIFFFCLLKIGL